MGTARGQLCHGPIFGTTLAGARMGMQRAGTCQLTGRGQGRCHLSVKLRWKIYIFQPLHFTKGAVHLLKI